MHADRTNRFMLSLIGLIALALGVGGLLAAGGVFGHHFQHQQLTANRFSRYVGHHGVWLWPAIAAVAFVLVLLALCWLLRLLFSTDRAGGVTITTTGEKREREDGHTAGQTTMTPAALSQAVAAEIQTYHGVTGAKGRILGDPHHPTLAIEVTASRRAELRPLIERIETQAISHARTALEQPDLPVKLDIAINDKTVSRTR